MTTGHRPVKRAHEALGVRLRQLRKAAGLTGRALAVHLGIHYTRLSKIEDGVVVPTEQNIRDWCQHTNSAAELDDILATVRNLATAYVEFQKQARAGLRKMETPRLQDRYATTKLFRIHEINVIPGVFQTEAYTRAMLDFWWDFLGIPNDTDATIAAKAVKNAHAMNSAKRVVAVIEEEALRMRFGTPEVHVEQLTHLITVQRLPYVSLGIIPSGIDRRACVAAIGFWIFDRKVVTMETTTAFIEVTRPSEVALWEKMFDRLQALAVYGRDARRLITKAMDGVDLTGSFADLDR